MTALLSRICPGRNGEPSVTSSSPVESTATRAAGWTVTSSGVDAGEHPGDGRRDERAGGEHGVAGTDVVSDAPGRKRRRSRRRDSRTRPPSTRLAVLDHRHRVGAVRQRRPGHDPHRLPGRDRPRERLRPGGDLADDRQLDGHGGDVGGVHGVAVDRRVGERGTSSAATMSAASTRPRASAAATVTGASGGHASRTSRWASSRSITGHTFSAAEELAQLVAHRRVAQAELDRRGEEAERVARVVAGELAHHPVERRPRRLRPQGVGELDLAAPSGLQTGDLVEDVRRQHVAADDDQVARRLAGGRLLDHVADGDDAVGIDRARRVDHAVGADLLVGHLLQPDDAAAGADADPVHVGEQRGVPHQLVGQQHGEGLVAHRLPRRTRRRDRGPWGRPGRRR